jgi:hypothetical protein
VFRLPSRLALALAAGMSLSGSAGAQPESKESKAAPPAAVPPVARPMSPFPFPTGPQAVAPAGGGTVIIIVVPSHPAGVAAQPMFVTPVAPQAVPSPAGPGRRAEPDELRNDIRALVEAQTRLMQVIEAQERRLQRLEQRLDPQPVPPIPAPSAKK